MYYYDDDMNSKGYFNDLYFNTKPNINGNFVQYGQV
jgi:hypothetical protein